MEQGNSIVLVTSDVGELAAMSDRVLVLDDGVIKHELSGDDVRDSAIQSLLEETES